MGFKVKVFVISILLALMAFAPLAIAKPSEFDILSRHIQKEYGAKKVHVPFLWLANAVVHVARPAGVNSFGIALFNRLNFSFDTIDGEMQQAMRSAFGPEWSSVFHVRSRDGQQAYMYMRDTGKDIKLAVVTIQKDQAVLIRASIDPERLAKFINDPSIFGISLDDKKEDPAAIPAGH